MTEAVWISPQILLLSPILLITSGHNQTTSTPQTGILTFKALTGSPGNQTEREKEQIPGGTYQGSLKRNQITKNVIPNDGVHRHIRIHTHTPPRRHFLL